MKCPNCNTPMLKGYTFIRAPHRHELLKTPSSLCFAVDGDNVGTKVIEEWDKRKSEKCSTCETLVILKVKVDESELFVRFDQDWV